MGTLEVDWAFEQLSAYGAGEVLIEFGIIIDIEGECMYLPDGEETKHLERLIFHQILIILLHY
jgi:hypothetical protein